MATITTRRAIDRYVFEYAASEPGVTSVSSFRAALRDARQLTGRHVDTGVLRPRLVRGRAVWPGTLTYLVLLDQIGQAIAPRRRPPTRDPFLDALTDFAPTLDQRDREMLYALRCAFAHEFSLTNVGRGPNAHLRQHMFELYEAGERRLAIYPTGTWNGRYGRKANRKTGVTRVNVTELGNIVEELVGRIEDDARAGRLRLVNGVTPSMLISRWGFQVITHR